MIMKGKTMRKRMSEEEIDNIVVAQADNDSAWEEAIHVRKTEATSLAIPADLAARAAFLARLHKETGLGEWLTRIIRERIEIEEGAFVEARRQISVKGSA